jgi:hypothetical protein
LGELHLEFGLGGVRESVAILIVAGILLSGCTQAGGTKKSAPLAPAPAVPLAATDIQSTLSGKSWRFQGPRNTGTTLYASDGTSLVEVDGKGTTKGKWTTKDGQLCESFDAAPWLPGGVPMSCYPFTRGSSPGTYKAGPATFTLES